MAGIFLIHGSHHSKSQAPLIMGTVTPNVPGMRKRAGDSVKSVWRNRIGETEKSPSWKVVCRRVIALTVN